MIVSGDIIWFKSAIEIDVSLLLPVTALHLQSTISCILKVSLTCDSREQNPRYYWSKEDGRLPANSVSVGNFLTLSNFRAADSGVYVCTVVSNSGTSSANHQLVIEPVSIICSLGIVLSFINKYL